MTVSELFNVSLIETILKRSETFMKMDIQTVRNRVSQPVFRGTLVFRGAIFSVPQNNKKIKKQTSSNERNKKIFLVLSRY
jgi:hypothetical protein